MEVRLKEDAKSKPIKSCRDLKIYQASFDLAMEIFNITKHFPKSETYSLTDQIRRSSRSISANIREGYAKRKYENIFIKHLNDALGSSEETRTWLEFSKECGYLDSNDFLRLDKRYQELSAMIYSLMDKWQVF